MSACVHGRAWLLLVTAAFAAAGPFDDAVKAGEPMPRLHSLLVNSATTAASTAERCSIWWKTR